jgi:putative membrane protein
MQRSLKDYLVISLKGMAMGAADVVPGVSGGTIALITGIYKELIETISSFDLALITTLRKEGIKTTFKSVNGTFLVFLIGGILTSILSLARLFHYLIENKPVLVWSFFFGLIIASVFLVGKLVLAWNSKTIFALLTGTVISFGITLVSPANGPDAIWFLFLSGMLAFVAMILPGISGSFILLLLGAYTLVLGKVNDFLDALGAWQLDVLLSTGIAIGVFMVGGVLGLLSFSKVLKFMFHKYEALTLALLTGFLVGSLNKVWPWKTNTEIRIKHEGTAEEEIVPFLQSNVWPGDYSVLSDADIQLGIMQKEPQVLLAIVLALFGFLVLFGMERLAGKKE